MLISCARSPRQRQECWDWFVCWLWTQWEKEKACWAWVMLWARRQVDKVRDLGREGRWRVKWVWVWWRQKWGRGSDGWWFGEGI